MQPTDKDIHKQIWRLPSQNGSIKGYWFMYAFHFRFASLAFQFYLLFIFIYLCYLPSFHIQLQLCFCLLTSPPQHGPFSLFLPIAYTSELKKYKEKNLMLLSAVGFRYLGQPVTSLVTVPGKLPRLPCQQGTVLIAENIPIVILMALAIKYVIFESSMQLSWQSVSPSLSPLTLPISLRLSLRLSLFLSAFFIFFVF